MFLVIKEFKRVVHRSSMAEISSGSSLEERFSRTALSPRYIEAVRRMFDQLNISARKIENFDDIKRTMAGSLQEPKTFQSYSHLFINNAELFKFIIDDELTIMIFGDNGGERSYLFTGPDGAGFVHYASGGRAIYLFYTCPKGSVEMDELAGTYAREVGGVWNRYTLASDDLTGLSNIGGKGEIDELWRYVLGVMEERVQIKEGRMLLAMSFAGMMPNKEDDGKTDDAQ